jgi:Mg-chelatase subunit ChlD
MYGGLTLTNYWLEKQAEYSQTEDLWQTSEQPITAVKEAVKVFLAFLQEVDTDDKLGLSVYTSSNSTAKLEHQLTRDFDTVETISRQRQAGHYDAMTNIAAGMKSAREEIEDNARLGAFKMMILMTDGQANLPGNSSQSKQAALDEAYLAAAKNIPIVTISLGSGADIDLMDEIASITNGVHFNIPGGQPVEAYEEDLKEVFRKIADDRPLKLVK